MNQRHIHVQFDKSCFKERRDTKIVPRRYLNGSSIHGKVMVVYGERSLATIQSRCSLAVLPVSLCV